MDEMLTSHTLARMLLDSDDVPLVLRVRGAGDLHATVLTDASVSLNEHSQCGTEWGDIPKALRLSVIMIDNA